MTQICVIMWIFYFRTTPPRGILFAITKFTQKSLLCSSCFLAWVLHTVLGTGALALFWPEWFFVTVVTGLVLSPARCSHFLRTRTLIRTRGYTVISVIGYWVARNNSTFSLKSQVKLKQITVVGRERPAPACPSTVKWVNEPGGQSRTFVHRTGSGWLVPCGAMRCDGAITV